MGGHAVARGVGLFALGACAAFLSCRAPTEITLVISTDVPCSSVRGTSITVGQLGEIEAKPATTTSTFCASGDLGVLVVVPSGGNSDGVAMKVVAGVGRDPSTCVPPYGLGCIVARRAMHFVPHTPLRIAVPLRAACNGVSCDANTTCVDGTCIAALISDPGQCISGDGCGEGSLTPPTDAGTGAGGADASTDAGVDGPVGPALYNDPTIASFWSAVDLSTVSAATTGGYIGAAFDGRYVYFVPNATSLALQYDTLAAFGSATSWASFDTTTVSALAHGFAGAANDGRYIYFVPNTGSLVTRYDTQSPFQSASSWSTFDSATLDPGATRFVGAAFDGRYIYLAPSPNNVVARYDTRAPFGVASSWSTFQILGTLSSAAGADGAVFDGRYVYFLSWTVDTSGRDHGVVLRYDVQAPFGVEASWKAFDVGGGTRFYGGVFDGRSVMFSPALSVTNGYARYDTQASFDDAGSWSVQGGLAATTSYEGAAFDGRYAYFVPTSKRNTAQPPRAVPISVLTRLDTQASYAFASVDLNSVVDAGGQAGGFVGAAFDGRYIYLVPNMQRVVVRFDAKTPPSLPPTFSGSFL